MTGLTQLLDAGVSGVLAATEAMQTVSNNTANVNTPGYNVESVSQSELPGGAGEPGVGVDVTGIQRAYEQFVYQQLVDAGSLSQAAQTTEASAENLSALLPVASGGAGGLGAALTSFFAAVNGVTQDPTSLPERQDLLSNAQSLAATFNSVGSQLATNLSNLNGQMTQAVQQINTLTQQIAAYNQQIMTQSTGAAGAPNSLLDTRDELVQQLGQEIGVVLVPNAAGAVDVYTTGGAVLVAGGNAYQLATGTGSYGNAGSAEITYAPTGQNLTDTLTGGTVGGLVTAIGQVVGAQDSVGAIAASLAGDVNTQQSLGLDLNGDLGQALFSTTGPLVTPAASNTGSATLSATISDPAEFTPGDFILTDAAGGFEAVNTQTGQSTALGGGPSLSLDGMTIAVSGTAAVGDSFLLQPTASAAQALQVVAASPAAIAAASPYVVTAGDNTGNVAASIGPAVSGSTLPAGTVTVPAADFSQNLSIDFTSAATFNILSSTGGVIASGSFSATSGAEIAIAYPAPAPSGQVVTVTLSPGTPAAGDSFALSPGGTGSNGNIVALANLANQDLISGQTLASAYAELVGTVGSNGQAASVAVQAAQGVLTQAQTVQQSISGVNLDQQAAELVNYEQAYQAAATVIGTAQTLFSSLIAAVEGV